MASGVKSLVQLCEEELGRGEIEGLKRRGVDYWRACGKHGEEAFEGRIMATRVPYSNSTRGCTAGKIRKAVAVLDVSMSAIKGYVRDVGEKYQKEKRHDRQLCRQANEELWDEENVKYDRHEGDIFDLRRLFEEV